MDIITSGLKFGGFTITITTIVIYSTYLIGLGMRTVMRNYEPNINDNDLKTYGKMYLTIFIFFVINFIVRLTHDVSLIWIIGISVVSLGGYTIPYILYKNYFDSVFSTEKKYKPDPKRADRYLRIGLYYFVIISVIYIVLLGFTNVSYISKLMTDIQNGNETDFMRALSMAMELFIVYSCNLLAIGFWQLLSFLHNLKCYKFIGDELVILNRVIDTDKKDDNDIITGYLVAETKVYYLVKPMNYSVIEISKSANVRRVKLPLPLPRESNVKGVAVNKVSI